jgi:hypothetical protein
MKKQRWIVARAAGKTPYGLALGIAALQTISVPAPGQTLGDALNAPSLIWTTGGNTAWFGETNTSHDGVSAAQSGAIPVFGQQSTLQTSVTGPGTLTFWWRMASQVFISSLSFSINGAQQANVPPAGWQQQTAYVGQGAQILLWNCKNNTGYPSTGWVDQVTFTLGGTAPIVTAPPVNRTVPAGTNVTLGVAAVGTPPLTYLWEFMGTNIPFATNSVLNLINVQSPDNGSYGVVVSNAYGVTNVSANLIVNPSAPVIIVQPQTQLLPPRGNAFFQVAAEGSLPLTFQWQFNSTDIGGATNSAILVTGLQTNNAGMYQVVVTNIVGDVTSAPATLTLVASAIIGWGNNNYGQASPPTSVTNATAIAAGGLHGMALRNDSSVTAWGENDEGQTNVPPNLANVRAIAGGEDFSLALKGDGTVTAWGWNYYGQTNVPAGLSNVVAISGGRYHALALKADGTVVSWGQTTDGLAIFPPGLSNVVAIDAGADHDLVLRGDGTVVSWGKYSAPTNVPPGLSNLVAVEAGAAHSVALKADGTVVAWGGGGFGQTEVPAGLSNVVAISAGDGHTLALRGDGTVVGWGAGMTNDGSYNNSGQSLVPTGLTNVVAISGGQTFSLALLNDGSPFIARQPPLNLSAHTGATVMLSVGATGTPPLSYQWQFDGTNVAGATNATLVLTNMPLSSAGTYRCLVSN